MIWATVSSQSCFRWLYRASPSLAAENVINLTSVPTIWWCPCVESSLVLLGEGVFSWENPVILCPASFCTPRPNLPVIPGVSWLPTFAFQSPVMKRISFLRLVLAGLVGLYTSSTSTFKHYWLGHTLVLPWYWMVCLENEQRSFFCFWDYIQVLHFRLFCWLWWLLHLFYGIPAHSSRYIGHLS